MQILFNALRASSSADLHVNVGKTYLHPLESKRLAKMTRKSRACAAFAVYLFPKRHETDKQNPVGSTRPDLPTAYPRRRGAFVGNSSATHDA